MMGDEDKTVLMIFGGIIIAIFAIIGIIEVFRYLTTPQDVDFGIFQFSASPIMFILAVIGIGTVLALAIVLKE